MKTVLQGVSDNTSVWTEDRGVAKMLQVDARDGCCLFVRIQSYDETKEHEELNALIGKKITITIEDEEVK